MTTTQNRVQQGVPTGGQFAATARAEATVTLPSPTAPKVTSRGRTTCVTLPDGSVATRTSKSNTYTHAVVLSAEVPELVIKDREETIQRNRQRIEDLQEALKDPKFKKRRRFPSDKDPDVDSQGKPFYHGFEYVMVGSDVTTVLVDTRGNSKGETQGMYDAETGEFDIKKIGRAVQFLKDKARVDISRCEADIAKAQADIDSVKAGTYNLGKPGVVSWSSRVDLARKAANQYGRRTRHSSVVEVDK